MRMQSLNYERNWNNMFYLMMGFASVWLLVTLYLVYLGVRQRQLDAEMKALREELDASARTQG